MPDEAARHILELLTGVQRSPAGGWTARCPAHEDRTPSLSVSVGRDGRVLLHCFAGCSPEFIVHAIGLNMTDLFESHAQSEPNPMRNTQSSTNWGELARTLQQQITQEQVAALASDLGVAAAALRAIGVGWAPRATLREMRAGGSGWKESFPEGAYAFPERSATGAVVGLSLRAADGRKGAPGGAKRGLIFPVAARPGGVCLVVEGASDVAACLTMGIAAVGRPSCAGGAAELAARLREEDIIIVGENDQRDDGPWPGRVGAERVAAALSKAWGREVPVGFPPTEDKDIRAYLKRAAAAREAALTADDVVRLRESLLAQVRTHRQPSPPAVPLRTWHPFPVDALPSPITGYVDSAARAIGADPSMIALPLLAALGAAIGTSCAIEAKRDGWYEFPILWAVVVAKSGSMKSPAWDRGVSALLALDDGAQAAHASAADHDADEETPEPSARPGGRPRTRYVVQDTTIEGLAPILRDNPRGVLLACDELSGWLASFDRYTSGSKGGDAARWLEAFRGNRWTIDRKTGRPSDRHIRVPCAAVSIAGTIQPGVLRRLLGAGHLENGLAARLLMVMPPAHAKSWKDVTTPPALVERVRDVFERLVGLELGVDNRGRPRPRALTLSPEAKAAWTEFYNRHALDQHGEPDEDVAAALAKLEAYALRIALITQLVRWAAEGGTAPMEMIDLDSMQRAVTLTSWLIHEVRRVYGVFRESPADRERRGLLEWIRGRGEPVSPRDLSRHQRRFGGRPDLAERALQDLADRGFGSFAWSKQPPTGGQPGQRFTPFPPEAPGSADSTP